MRDFAYAAAKTQKTAKDFSIAVAAASNMLKMAIANVGSKNAGPGVVQRSTRRSKKASK